MNSYKNQFINLKFLLKIHLTGLAFFLFFRIVLLILQQNEMMSLPNSGNLLVNAFWLGLRFDNVIACYFMFFPLLVLAVLSCLNINKYLIIKILLYYFAILYTIAFIICSADIPYYIQFGKRINSSIFNWATSFWFAMKMIIQEWTFFIFVVGFFILDYIFIRLIFRYGKAWNEEQKKATKLKNEKKVLFVKVLISFLLLSFCFLGIRGRIEKKSPIRVGTAFFSNFNLPNQLALNPVFNFLRSCLDNASEKDMEINLLDEKEALKFALFSLQKDSTETELARQISPDTLPRRTNVIVVLMEGLSADYLKYFGGTGNRTPFLDSLMLASYSFENIYSSGIHTMNGIYSTFTGYPSLLQQHPLNFVDIPVFSNIANILQTKGYKTLYFTTHDDQFDNVAGFLNANGIQKIISQTDYPSGKVLSTLGVPDDYMFEFAMPILSKTQQPFFATLLTTSNHGPIIVPDYYKKIATDGKNDIIQFSDWALKKFYNACKKQTWFKNTIFVFLADHGGIYKKNDYEMSLSYHHSPLILNCEAWLKPQINKNIGGQIDIFPTIMGFLNENYINTSFGIDLIKEKRPYIYFTADDKIGCIDSSFFFIHTIADKKDKLFKLNDLNKINYAKNELQKLKEMRQYSFSMLQSAQYMLKLKKKEGKKLGKKM